MLLAVQVAGGLACAQRPSPVHETRGTRTSADSPHAVVEDAKSEFIKLQALVEMLTAEQSARQEVSQQQSGPDSDSRRVPPSAEQLKREIDTYEAQAAELYNRIHQLASEYALKLTQQAGEAREKQRKEAKEGESTRGAPTSSARPTLFPVNTKRTKTGRKGRAVDPVRLADLLFRSADYAAAYEQYQQVAEGVRDERLKQWVDFQIAACLRHMGKLSEAAAKYRELIASSPEGDLAKAARWHLQVISWRQETEARLKALKARRLQLERALDHVPRPK